jgi:hypothetical protein
MTEISAEQRAVFDAYIRGEIEAVDLVTAPMNVRGSGEVIHLTDELDEALQPWTCPQCRRVYQPPLTTYISPTDSLERCASCAEGEGRNEALKASPPSQEAEE